MKPPGRLHKNQNIIDTFIYWPYWAFRPQMGTNPALLTNSGVPVYYRILQGHIAAACRHHRR
jgi:hypothetical protein